MSCRTTSGGSASFTLARAVTGLTDREVQHLFHALKREGDGMPPPSEFDLTDWRDRQQHLLGRLTRLSTARADSIRARLFRARSEPVPDGATFYAWSRIEHRARQEAVLRDIDNAIDLAPPGSQSDQYVLGPDGRPQRVWYASYGSNLNRARFLTYIEGGQPPGSQRVYRGCTDTTAPASDIAIRFAGARPHFALTSSVWRGGIAFIDANKGESAMGLGRAYDISTAQFDEVVAQENGGSPETATAVPLDEVLVTGRAVTGPGAYQTILHIGDHQGAPVLTFTAPFSTRDALVRQGSVRRSRVRMPVMTNQPSAAYVQMIGGGLRETFDMDEVAQADYIRGCPGGDRWSRQSLVKVLRGETEARPTEAGPARATASLPAATFSAAGTSGSTTPPRRQQPRGTNRRAAAAPSGPGGPPRSTGPSAYPPVRTYATKDEQQEGVRRWARTRREAAAALQEAKSGHAAVAETLARAERRGASEALADARAAHAASAAGVDLAVQALSEATAKHEKARRQSPATWYPPASARTASEWRSTGEELHRQAMSISAALDAARSGAAASAKPPKSAAAAAAAKSDRDHLRALDRQLTEIEQRLEEVDANRFAARD